MRRYDPKHGKTITLKGLKILAGIIVFFGILLALGAVGGCDHGAMPVGRALIYVVCGGCACIGGLLAIAFFDQFID